MLLYCLRSGGRRGQEWWREERGLPPFKCLTSQRNYLCKTAVTADVEVCAMAPGAMRRRHLVCLESIIEKCARGVDTIFKDNWVSYRKKEQRRLEDIWGKTSVDCVKCKQFWIAGAKEQVKTEHCVFTEGGRHWMSKSHAGIWASLGQGHGDP